MDLDVSLQWIFLTLTCWTTKQYCLIIERHLNKLIDVLTQSNVNQTAFCFGTRGNNPQQI